jgi:hypothetical protein
MVSLPNKNQVMETKAEVNGKQTLTKVSASADKVWLHQKERGELAPQVAQVCQALLGFLKLEPNQAANRSLFDCRFPVGIERKEDKSSVRQRAFG